VPGLRRCERRAPRHHRSDQGVEGEILLFRRALQQLRTSLVIPMHFFGGASLQRFLANLKGGFQIEVQKEPTTVVSVATLPKRPTVRVLPGY